MLGKKFATPALIILSGLMILSFQLQAQKKTKNYSLNDSLDGALDLSDYIIEDKGFVPVPLIITEAALGGFGGGFLPVFITKNSPYIDTVNGQRTITPVAPDITGGVAIYTVNDSWLTAAFRSGTIVKWRLKYTVGGGYANINMSFFGTTKREVENEYKFNFKIIPFFIQAIKRVGYTHLYLGGRYMFLHSTLTYKGDQLLSPEFARPEDYDNTISQLGATAEYDGRDNIFTPDEGVKAHLDVQCSNKAIGSDYDYWLMNYYAYGYAKLSPKLIGGLRIDGQQTFSDPPFFMLPYLSLRGIPVYRYQGYATILTEAEARWDVVRRWSIMLYGGTGKAFDDWDNFANADWQYSYGTGFRYLLARKFKLRMGLDVAFGPGSWGYYIVFGTNWMK